MATIIFNAPVPARLPTAQKPFFPTIGVPKVVLTDSLSMNRAFFDKPMRSKHGRSASPPPIGQFVFVANNGGSDDISAFAFDVFSGGLIPVPGSLFPDGNRPDFQATP
jgi:hypothetical protein